MREQAVGTGLFGVTEAAEQLGVHTNTVRRWSSRGLLRAYRIGPRGDRRFRQEDIDAFVASVGETQGNGNGDGNGGCRVLIVDDDILVCETLQDMVERQDCTAMIADSVGGALAHLSRARFELAFIALGLEDSDGDGFDVLQAVVQTSERTVVAVLVGERDRRRVLQAMSYGPMFVVHKPLEVRHIAKIIGAAERVHA